MEAKIEDRKMNLNVNIEDRELFALMINTHENVENAINKYGEFKQLIKDFNTIGDDMYKHLKEKYGQKITLIIDPDDAIEDDYIKCCICGGEFHRLSEQHMQEKMESLLKHIEKFVSMNRIYHLFVIKKIKIMRRISHD